MNQPYASTTYQPGESHDQDPMLRFAKRWWWLLSIGAVIGIAAAIIYLRVGPIPYQSTALLQVVPPSGATTAAQAEQARSASANFAAEVASPRMYALVSEALAGTLDISPDELEAMERNKKIDVTPQRTSNFIRIVVTDSDKDRAQLIANTFAQVFVDDIALRAQSIFDLRQAQVEEQIQFTREQLATSALRQREIDLESEIRKEQANLLNLQSSYQQELGRQAEADALGDRASFTGGETQQLEEVRLQLLRAISQQISASEANIAALNSDLDEVRAELETLPPDVDGSLSAAFTSAYSLQLSTLTERYVADEIASLTQSTPVLRYGNASTPFATQGIKKLGLFGLMGGVAAASAIAFAIDLFRKWRASRTQRDSLTDTGTMVPDFERLMAMVNELAGRPDATGSRPGTIPPRAERPATAGD